VADEEAVNFSMALAMKCYAYMLQVDGDS